MKDVLEFLLKVVVLAIGIYFLAGALKGPEPIPEPQITTEYIQAEPDTVTVLDTVYVQAVFPVKADTVDEGIKLSLDTLHIHDEYTSVRVWSRDIAVEGVKIDVRTIVKQVEIVRVDTLYVEKIIHIPPPKQRFYETREFGFVAGFTAAILTAYSIRPRK